MKRNPRTLSKETVRRVLEGSSLEQEGRVHTLQHHVCEVELETNTQLVLHNSPPECDLRPREETPHAQGEYQIKTERLRGRVCFVLDDLLELGFVGWRDKRFVDEGTVCME